MKRRLIGSSTLLLGVALVAAAGAATPKAAAPASTPLPIAAPAAEGMSAARLAAMGDHFRRETARNAAPGYVMMVARHGKLLYSASMGMRDVENKLPMTMDTRFRIASMSKPITAVAVLMLYEEGRLQLDDPVSRYLPAFADSRVYSGTDAAGNITTEPLKRPMTIRHLLTHTSGLGYGPGYDQTSPLAKTWAALNLGGTDGAADKIKKLAAMPLYSQPGDAWRYSYANDVLGYLVEVVSGMPFERFLQTRLFDPLGMKHTGFYIPPDQAQMLAGIYKHKADGSLERADGGPAFAPTKPPQFPSGGGGLISTAGDYLRFAQMLANNGTFEGREYLSPVTVALMTSNQVADDAMAKYWGDNSRGLGYGLGVAPIIDFRYAPQANLNGDYSWGGAFDTHWLVSPRSGIVAVLLTQAIGGGNASGNASSQRTYVDFRNQLYQAVVTLDR